MQESLVKTLCRLELDVSDLQSKVKILEATKTTKAVFIYTLESEIKALKLKCSILDAEKSKSVINLSKLIIEVKDLKSQLSDFKNAKIKKAKTSLKDDVKSIVTIDYVTGLYRGRK